MFKKYYNIHTITLIAGIIFFLANFILEAFFKGLNLSIFLRIATISCFIVTMFCYIKIILIFSKVTSISKAQTFLAIFAHTLTLVAICLWHYVTFAVSLAFIGSVVIRRLAGISEIDDQMKDLCEQLDFELYKIGNEIDE